MRELKFRAWDGSKIINNIHQHSDFNFHCMGSYKDYQLMQFTGLKDKNGVGIYKDDVVKGKFPYADTAVVVWDVKRCGFFLKPLNRTGRAVADRYYKMNSCKLERAGNIYENPELLEN